MALAPTMHRRLQCGPGWGGGLLVVDGKEYLLCVALFFWLFWLVLRSP